MKLWRRLRRWLKLPNRDYPKFEWGRDWERMFLLFNPACQCLERELWTHALKGLVAKSSVRGLEGWFGRFHLMSWSCAGRTMITLRDGLGDWVTVVVADKSDDLSMGVQASSLPVEKAAAWLWEAGRSRRIPCVQENREVMIGMSP